MRQVARKTTWHAGARLHADGSPRCWLLEIRLSLFRLPVGHWLDRWLRLTPAVLRERFARQQNVIFTALRRSRTRAAVSTSSVVPARITLTLGRSILRGRQIPPAAVPVRAAVAVATTPPSPASAPSSSSAIPAVSPRASVVPHAWRIISRGVIIRRKILRCGRIRLRLALLWFCRLTFRADFGGWTANF